MRNDGFADGFAGFENEMGKEFFFEGGYADFNGFDFGFDAEKEGSPAGAAGLFPFFIGFIGGALVAAGRGEPKALFRAIRQRDDETYRPILHGKSNGGFVAFEHIAKAVGAMFHQKGFDFGAGFFDWYGGLFGVGHKA